MGLVHRDPSLMVVMVALVSGWGRVAVVAAVDVAASGRSGRGRAGRVRGGGGPGWLGERQGGELRGAAGLRGWLRLW